MEKYATLRVQKRPEAILLVTLDRPEVANAFNTQAFNTQPALDLCDVFSRLANRSSRAAEKAAERRT